MKWLKKALGVDKQAAAPAVTTSATLQRSPDGVYVLRFSGTISKAAMDRIHAFGVKYFATDEEARARVWLIG